MKKIKSLLLIFSIILFLVGCEINRSPYSTPDMKNVDADALIQATLNELGFKYTVKSTKFIVSSGDACNMSIETDVDNASGISYYMNENYAGYYVTLIYSGSGNIDLYVESKPNYEAEMAEWERFIYNNPKVLELLNKLIVKPYDIEKFYKFEEEYVSRSNKKGEEDLWFHESKRAEFPDISGGKYTEYRCWLAENTDPGEIRHKTYISFHAHIDPALIKETSSAQASSTPA